MPHERARFTRTTASGRVIATFEASGDTRKQALTSELEILRADLARIICDTAGARPGVEFVYRHPSALDQVEFLYGDYEELVDFLQDPSALA
jgi:hypothetical protein